MEDSSKQMLAGLFILLLGCLGVAGIMWFMNEPLHGYILGKEGVSYSTTHWEQKKMGSRHKVTYDTTSKSHVLLVLTDEGETVSIRVSDELYKEAQIGQRIDNDAGFIQDYCLSDDFNQEILEQVEKAQERKQRKR